MGSRDKRFSSTAKSSRDNLEEIVAACRKGGLPKFRHDPSACPVRVREKEIERGSLETDLNQIKIFNLYQNK
jgi:hypothetical protein